MDDERQEELETLTAIYPEIITNADDAFSASLELPVSPASPLLIQFAPSDQKLELVDTSHPPDAMHKLRFSHLPPLSITFTLPPGYPADSPPAVKLSTALDWLPEDKISELENDVIAQWEEYRGQVLFGYIDHLQQAAERGFDLDGLLTLSTAQERDLVVFNKKTIQEIFDTGTYDCGICLDPKKGTACYRMKQCGHVFCRECLQDAYNNAIKEGDVSQVKCLEPGCSTETVSTNGQKRKRKTERTVRPRELLDMGVEEVAVRRYLEMRRKKKLEADKSTVYCPRTWCQGAAKSQKYPLIPSDLMTFITGIEVASDQDSDGEAGAESAALNNPGNIPPNISDRLAVCEQCEFAFCKVCYKSWHGPYERCFPRDPTELSAEEQASYDYIRKCTSPCAHCSAPVQKTMGCNHMICFNCKTHFCYLCGFWIPADNPYKHFNTQGSTCYQRLWELEEGDEGQAPEDGRGFGGARAAEVAAAEMAADVARQADAAEAARLQAEEDARVFPAVQEPPPRGMPLADVIAQINLGGDVRLPGINVHPPQPLGNPPLQQQPRGGRRQHNPFPAARPLDQGPAHAVRNHERAGRGGRGRGGQRPPAARAGDEREDIGDRQQINLANFLEAAGRNREDDWDSDEMGDDQDFHIPVR